MRFSRATAAVAATLALGAVGGCGLIGGGSSGSADCGTLIKAEGTVFTAVGSSSRHAERYSTALETVCEDVGRNARGAVFTDEARTLTTYRFPVYSTSEVLGVRFGDEGALTVFVADSINAHDRDQIARELKDKPLARDSHT